MNKYTKLVQTKALSVNEDARTIRWVISTDQEDRYGDIVDQDSWVLENYKANPILLWGHDPSRPENVLGTTSDWQSEADPDRPGGRRTTALLTFDTDINEKAELVYQQAKRGTLRTGSIGYMAHDVEMKDDRPLHKNNELLEFSIVPIPANPRAIALSLKDGSLHKKDAQWLVDSMRKEADLIESETKPKQENKSMTEAQEKMLGDVAEAVKALDTKVDSVVEKQDAFAADLTAVKDAQTKAAETSEPKPDPAKGGESDQPGAGEDEFGDDTQLTPEQEAEMDAKFAEQMAEAEAAVTNTNQ